MAPTSKTDSPPADATPPADDAAAARAAAQVQALQMPSDEASVAARQLASGSAPSGGDDQVKVRAKGVFHAAGNFVGPMVVHGEEFQTSRGRAAELRANGLIEYSDDKAEEEASKDDGPQPNENGQPIITSRNIRRRPV